MAATLVVVLSAILGIAIYKFYPVAIVTKVQKNSQYHICRLPGSGGVLRISPFRRIRDLIRPELIRRLDAEKIWKRMWRGSFAALDDRR